eukprot:6066077-Prymnesium_polylepis.2
MSSALRAAQLTTTGGRFSLSLSAAAMAPCSSADELVELTAALLADECHAAALAAGAKAHVDAHHSVAREAEMYAEVVDFALREGKPEGL